MDLRNNTITVAELMKIPAAMAIFRRRFGKLANHPMLSSRGTLTLAQLIEMSGVMFPKKVIQDTLEELKKI